MAKYDQWRDHLEGTDLPTIIMTFDELEELVPLPSSARTYDLWWANEDVNTTAHVQCKSWQAAGYVADVDMRRGVVTFTRR